MKRFIISLLLSALILTASPFTAHADLWDDIIGAASDAWDWTSGAATDAWDWTTGAASDAWDWTTGAATDAWNWTAGAAGDAWSWTSKAATDAWNATADFFAPPSNIGNPNIPAEPELPNGVQRCYVGYGSKRIESNKGYSGGVKITKDDPHYGWELGKFYISGFTRVLPVDDTTLMFLKTVGDDVELHFHLTQDIDMLNSNTLLTVANDDGGYDEDFGVQPTYLGRGALIVRHYDYEHNPGKTQIYTDYLSAKASGSADTVISLNEEGDYEVALDYRVLEKTRVLGTAATSSSFYNYRIYFRFSVRNGNCMAFPFDVKTGEELRNSSVTPNGFYLDFAYSRYLDIDVSYSVIVEGENGFTEDVRFNRPAQNGTDYAREGIYTLTVSNRYTGEKTVKLIYVGSDERIAGYMRQGYTTAQLLDALNGK
ncbi:MAG: hypothetical protein IKR85_05460 [Clostridia bacterium]|nr:hypothetical protein [Clostridia bacterium]